MKRKIRITKKHNVMMTSLALILTFAVGITLAVLFDLTNKVDNAFTPSEVTCKVSETIEDHIKKDVKIQNTSDISAYIRAKVIVTWKDENGNVYGETPIEDQAYSMDWFYEEDASQSSYWLQGKDGFYYYLTSVEEEETTEVLFTNCKLMENVTPPEGYFLNVEIISSAIQADPDNAVEESWSNNLVKIDANSGTLSIADTE